MNCATTVLFPRRADMSAPWWDELSEYPSPLDVKELRKDATLLLDACRRVVDLTANHPLLAAEMDIPLVLAAIAKAEGR